MPSETLHDFKSRSPGFITEWTVAETSSGDDVEITCTKAAEANKTHFITFLSVSTDARLTGLGGGVNAELKSASTTKYLIWPRALLEAASYLGIMADGTMPIGTPAAKTLSMDEDSGPWFHEFEAPIQMGENEAVTFTSSMDGATDKVSFTMGGFTSSVRIN